MEREDVIIELAHLEKSFGGHGVLKDINLSVKRGEVISVIGSSGSGKSTMLRCINLLEAPTGGQIFFEGQDITAKGVKLTEYRTKVGMVFQGFNLFGNMTALANCVQPPLSESAQMKQDLSKLNVLAIGDSHFNGSDTQWMTLLSNQLGWNLTNLGKSGWTVACNPEAYPEGERVRNSMYDYLYNSSSYVYGSTNSNYYTCGDTSGKTAADVDLILFEGGWNDFMWGIPLGTVDSKDGSTLQGARNLIIEKLLADYPNAKIVILTEWHRDGTRKNDSETRLNFVSDSLKALYAENYAENDRVVLIDAGDPAVSGVDMTDASWYPTYAPDQTHLNEEGMKIFAENILPYLWEAYTGKEAQ